MKGLYINERGYLETATNGSTSLDLLFRGNGFEVMKQTIARDKMMILFPGESNQSQEFFYVLLGEVEIETEEGKIKLSSGSTFSVKSLMEPIHLYAVSEVIFLTVSNELTFHTLSQDIMELRKVGKMVEKKDHYTYSHSYRVSKYAIKTATVMKLNKNCVENLFLAAILHDIGKINIPEEVLNKPSKLTDEEFDIVKRHPIDGANMLRKTAYADLAVIVEQHHERLNGRGYPYGLKGDEISIEAKIIGVCDSYDAMTEDRAYRKAFTSEYALAEIKRLVGIQYDAEVVRAFEKVLQQDGQIS